VRARVYFVETRILEFNFKQRRDNDRVSGDDVTEDALINSLCRNQDRVS